MSNDTPDTNGTGDSVRAALNSEAAHVDIGLPGDALSEVRTTANGRRRRRNAMVGAAAAVTLVAGGVVVANVVNDGSDGDDLIVSSPVTDPPQDVDDADEPADEPAPDNETTPADDVVESGAESTPASTGGTETVAAEAQVIAPAESFAGSFQQVFPWQDGFISIGQTQPQQALPAELPDEIRAAFSDEVLQLFDDAGGLPPTIGEATAMLQEAGLYAEVSDVVLNNPEVSEAIYSAPVEPPVQFTRLSADGVEWTDLDLQVPGDQFGNRTVVSTGDRLVAVETEYASVEETADEPANPNVYREPQVLGINVHSTTDLQTWTTQRIDLATEAADLPDYVQRGIFPNGIAANDTGWVLSVESYQSIDYLALLPDDFDRSFEQSQGGYGLYHDSEGLVIDTYTEEGQGDQVRISWSELGFAEAPAGLEGEPFESSADGSSMWSSAWDSNPVESTIDEPFFGQIYGFDGGFVRQNERMSFSPDGVTWTDFDRPNSTGWVNATMAVPGGLLAFAGDGDGVVQAYRLDVDTLTWESVDEPVLPEGFSPWSDQSNGAMLYTIEDFSQYESEVMAEEFPVEPFAISITNDEYVLDVTIEGESQSYTVTEIATGEVVAGETVAAAVTEDSPFEFVTEIDDFIEVTSPDTGEILTTFTPEQLQAGVDETPRGSIADAPVVTAQPAPATTIVFEEGEEPPPPPPYEFVEPQLNVLATDGEVWINQSLDIAQPEGADPAFGPVNYPQNAVVNNGIVLVSMSDGSFVRFTF